MRKPQIIEFKCPLMEPTVEAQEAVAAKTKTQKNTTTDAQYDPEICSLPKPLGTGGNGNHRRHQEDQGDDQMDSRFRKATVPSSLL